MSNYSMAYSYFGCCENHKFNLFHSISSSLHDIVQASLAFHSSVQPKYVMDNLVICENRVNTHTHTFSSRVFYRKYLKCQNISKPREEDISNFSGFTNRFLRLIYAMVLRGPRNIASSCYGVTSQHSPCHVGNAVFSLKSN